MNDEQVFGNSAHRNYVLTKNDAAVNGIIQKNYPPPRFI
jgi:hypothetical protein